MHVLIKVLSSDLVSPYCGNVFLIAEIESPLDETNYADNVREIPVFLLPCGIYVFPL